MTINKEALDALNEDLKLAEAQEGDYLYAIESAAETVAGWVKDYEERLNDPGEFYYWDLMNEYDDYNAVAHHYPYGKDTARIIGQKEGGVIAYVHKDHADAIVRALWLAGLA